MLRLRVAEGCQRRMLAVRGLPSWGARTRFAPQAVSPSAREQRPGPQLWLGLRTPCSHAAGFPAVPGQDRWASSVTRQRLALPSGKGGDMAPTYNPSEVESEWYEWWESNHWFRDHHPAVAANPGTRKPFSMLFPPPNVTGALHIGHALTVAVQDSLVRWRRMAGDEVVWVPGLDHAGIATQSVVERRLLMKEGRTRHDLGREEFLKQVWAWYEQHGQRINHQLRRLGATLDWEKLSFTMDEKRSAAVTEAFVRMFESGKVYRHHRMVNWCPHLRTAISDIEVDVEQLNGPKKLTIPGCDHPVEFGVMDTFSYPVKGSSELLHVSTTRLETMLGDVAVAVHPDDQRYQHLIGSFVQHPITGAELPILADPTLVDPEVGTGVVKITPAHDPNDLACAERHGLDQSEHLVPVIGDDGLLTVAAGGYAGMGRFEARDKLRRDLQTSGLYQGKEPHAMALARCSRSGDVLEPMLKPQWFVRCEGDDGVGKRGLEFVRSGNIKISPKPQEAEWFRWLGNIQDWCVSRQLWWGHRIPAYVVRPLSPKDAGASEAYDRVFTAVVSAVKSGKAPSNVTALDQEIWVVARSQADAEVALASIVGRESSSAVLVEQDPDVLDTWFSSALLPLSAFGWPELPADECRYPSDVMETGQDILFFWVARMAMVCGELSGGRAPFNHVLLHPIVRDASGRKMSKSLGNVIDPLDVIQGVGLEAMLSALASGNLSSREVSRASADMKRQFPSGIPECGSDALRFTLASYMNQGVQINMSPARVQQYRQFCNKLWNASRFVLHHIEASDCARHDQDPNRLGRSGLYLENPVSDLTVPDQWVLSRLAAAVAECEDGLQNFHLAQSTTALHRFFITEFCDIYIEWCKAVFASESVHPQNAETTRKVLATVLDGILRAMHPFLPFVTEELWQRLHFMGIDGRGSEALVGGPRSILSAPFPSGDLVSGLHNESAEIMMRPVLDVMGASRSVLKTVSDIFPGTKRSDLDIVVACGPAAAEEFQSLDTHARQLEFVLRAGRLSVDRTAEPDIAVSQTASPGVTVYVPLKGGDDVKEKVLHTVKRLSAKEAKLQRSVKELEFRINRLAADVRVPDTVVQKETTKAEAGAAELEAVRSTLHQLARLTDSL